MLIDDVKVVEIVLFVENRALPIEDIARMSMLPEDRTLKALSAIKEEYDKDYHGVCLENTKDGYVMSPKRTMYEKLKKTPYGKRITSRLTQAAVETLCLVAYNYGITRREIDDIRGVSSENTVDLLMRKNFIKVVGRRDLPGHPLMFGTTEKFLYEFNLGSIADLPRLDEMDSIKYEDKDRQGGILTGRVVKRGDRKAVLAAPQEPAESGESVVRDKGEGRV